MVVGTTGWYGEMQRVQALVEAGRHRLCIRRELLLWREFVLSDPQSRRAGAGSRILRPHHRAASRPQEGRAFGHGHGHAARSCRVTIVDITSEREGDVTGTHTLELKSPGDRIVLTHEAKSRRTFAEGAVLAAEWIVGRQGCYDFKDIFAD